MKERCNEIKKALIIRNARLDTLKNIDAPEVLIQNELKMIEELQQELSKQPEEIARKRKEKLEKLNSLDASIYNISQS